MSVIRNIEWTKSYAGDSATYSFSGQARASEGLHSLAKQFRDRVVKDAGPGAKR